MRLSIVVPVLDEAGGVRDVLGRLATLRRRGAQVIVADGGSQDDTPALARPHADQVIAAPRGRASQMNAGAAIASGDVLLFLHADTVLPCEADRLIAAGLRDTGLAWGRFDVAIAGRHRLLPVIAALMNRRSRLTGIATGDQAMFVRADAFARAGGFPDIPLMEDIAISRALKRISPPLCLSRRVITSGRRWEKNGVVRTIGLMWRLRLSYFLGADPARLARSYGYRPRDE
ncbi:TIGR04283 family arsenosugar biosynthesis glycosyltransferase [Salinarimonas soli]|uniref:Glycosyltransferase n=1 Tax=Salinarimonas soli TaxID=1638099 RepID=A0A5B2VGK1_9HYPH|nr:TIGR04283 family arsenosugar biosynthesis glycosyltransferase [Salinarimonas soli]KAA2238045.1 glycosyltransferase [Salinarimonas soli]